jgi:hypothetical protein
MTSVLAVVVVMADTLGWARVVSPCAVLGVPSSGLPLVRTPL